MVRRLGTLALAAAVVALVAGPALAQQRQPGGRGPGMFGGGMGGAMLLSQKAVQDELKLTDKQKEDLKAVQDKAMTAGREAFQKLQDIQDQQERRQKMQELMKTANEETMKEVSKILDEKQNKRFEELQLQSAAQNQGAAVFERPEVQKGLSLTDEQKSKIDTVVKDAQKERQDLFQQGGGGGAGGAGGGRGPNPEMMAKMQTIAKESLAKATDVLTADQKTTWKTMQGEPFKFPAPGARPDR